MAISEYHSTAVMPKADKPFPTILDFLTQRFPRIDRNTWKARINSGKVLTGAEKPVSLDTPYIPLKKLLYFREVEEETVIPFAEEIIFCNDDLLVACKPHFLPVTPAGRYVTQCLLHRLKEKTGNRNLAPINRIDRETAGLVLFSMNPKTRGLYQKLFMDGQVNKTYGAVAEYPREIGKTSWQVENRLTKGEPWFRMKTVPGKTNAVSKISLTRVIGKQAVFQLCPITGKKHQLRIHLSGLGFPILNDRYYPDLLPEKTDDFSAPLQLLSKKIQFQDPLSARLVSYESQRDLLFNLDF